jgi:selenocysteine lyase/cysteine desulfurase
MCESMSPIAAGAKEDFVGRFPDYGDRGPLDELRRREFSRLDRLGHVYLDFTGSGLYAESLIGGHAEILLGAVFGNPHSLNPTSRAATIGIEAGRRRVLEHFRADPGEYSVVFTANATQALKLVGEAFPFGGDSHFVLTFDNHNSVNGIREFARARGAHTHYVPAVPPTLRVEDDAVQAVLERAADSPGPRLFAYPAQSNFSGVQHPLAWIERAQALGYQVLLDAAAFAPTNRLDLSRVKPDFVTLSFYKMFGYPTGIGALVARREALARLHRPWFAGGTIALASVQADQFRFAEGEAAFEDGTPDFLGVPAVVLGLDLLQSVGMEAVHARMRALTAWLLEQLQALVHANGRPLLRLYGPWSTEARGATLAFNLVGADGEIIEHRTVDERAAAQGLSLRTGCFCNPGAGELAFGLSPADITTCLNREPVCMTYDEFRRCIDPKAAGAVRASLGLASNFADAWRLVAFLEGFAAKGATDMAATDQRVNDARYR